MDEEEGAIRLDRLYQATAKEIPGCWPNGVVLYWLAYGTAAESGG